MTVPHWGWGFRGWGPLSGSVTFVVFCKVSTNPALFVVPSVAAASLTPVNSSGWLRGSQGPSFLLGGRYPGCCSSACPRQGCISSSSQDLWGAWPRVELVRRHTLAPRAVWRGPDNLGCSPTFPVCKMSTVILSGRVGTRIKGDLR